MARRMRLWPLAALLAPLVANAVDLPERPIGFDRLRSEFGTVSVIIEGSTACILLDTLLADSDARRRRGLMWVRSMPDDAGMIFDYVRPRGVSMWMKNTLIPVDIAFISAEGRIINIAENTKPLSLDSIAAAAPARYALELNAGQASTFGLESGSTVWVVSP